MSFNRADEEKETFALFGELLQQLNDEYGKDVPSKSKVKKILKQMMEVVNDG